MNAQRQNLARVPLRLWSNRDTQRKAKQAIGNKRRLQIESLEDRMLLSADLIPKGNLTIELETLASGLISPVSLTHAGDGSGRMFIAEQTGQIRILHDGQLLPTPFLDISNELAALNPFFDERGLLGLAFHPKYSENGRFFVRYSAPRDGETGEPCFATSRGCHAEVLAEFSVSQDDPNLADPNSQIVLFRVDEPQFNHNSGEVAFGPDGFLYFTLGDGGGANDGLADVPPSHGPIGNGQNIETTLGSILRLNVDRFNICHNNRSIQVSTGSIHAHLRHGDSLGGCGGSAPIYTTPRDNPFVGQLGADEIYAYGFRNPFKFSFDDGPGGDNTLLLADVGQNLFEEVNIVEPGGNYGWVTREGTHCFDPFNPTSPPATCSATGPHGEPFIDPIVEYAHPNTAFGPEGGIAVVGGFVYRGSQFPELQGTYVLGDFSTGFFSPDGQLYFVEDPTGASPEIRRFQIGQDDRDYRLFLKGFGEDEDGEVYVLGSAALGPTGSTGVVQRIVSAFPAGESARLARNFVAPLSGSQEVPAIDTHGTGVARFTLNADGSALDYSLIVANIENVTQSHIHMAAPGTNGPVVAFLFGFVPGGVTVNGVLAEGTIRESDLVGPLAGMTLDDLLDAMRSGNSYVNVHTVDHPPGEIRGHIRPAGPASPANGSLVAFALPGANVVTLLETDDGAQTPDVGIASGDTEQHTERREAGPQPSSSDDDANVGSNDDFGFLVDLALTAMWYDPLADPLSANFTAAG